MKEKGTLVIIYNGVYSVKSPNIMFETHWNNKMSNPLEIRVHGYGKVKSVDNNNAITDNVIGRTEVEGGKRFQIAANSSRRLRINIRLLDEVFQDFGCQKNIKLQAHVPITYSLVNVEKGDTVRSDVAIRAPDKGTILDFKIL